MYQHYLYLTNTGNFALAFEANRTGREREIDTMASGGAVGWCAAECA